jgi:hypothetical protein
VNGAAVWQWCGFKSRRGKNKNLTALKSNSNTVWFNFQTYIYIYISRRSLKRDYFCICFKLRMVELVGWHLQLQSQTEKNPVFSTHFWLSGIVDRATTCCRPGDNLLSPSTLYIFGLSTRLSSSLVNIPWKHPNCLITFI